MESMWREKTTNSIWLSIIISQDDTIKSKNKLFNEIEFFKQIQWLHDMLVDMNYNEQYIHLLERE